MVARYGVAGWMVVNFQVSMFVTDMNVHSLCVCVQKGNTSLHIASLAGQEEVVKILIYNGAYVNVQAQVGIIWQFYFYQRNTGLQSKCKQIRTSWSSHINIFKVKVHVENGLPLSSLMPIACFVVEINQRGFVTFADPLLPCIKVKVIDKL